LHLTSAVGHDLPQTREAAVLVDAVPRMVPANEVEKLVTSRELHLPQALVCLDAGREPDLVAIRPVPATSARAVAKERTARAERADFRGEALERALDEERAGRHIQVRLCAPQLLAQPAELERP